MNLEGSLVAFCNPLLDITATVDDAFLEEYGLEANNAILAEEKHEALFEAMESRFAVSYSAGGAGQNTARAAQWLLPPRSTVYMGCVGSDEHGRLLKEIAERDGLRVEYMVEGSGARTGVCACLITGRNRSLVAKLGAANSYRLEHLLEESLTKCVHQARIIYITGFFLTVSPETIQHLAQIAHEHRKTLAMNLSAPFLARFFRQPMLDALPYVDLLFGNEAEALAFAEANELGTRDIGSIALALAAWPTAPQTRPRTVVITQGPGDTLIAKQSTLRAIPTPHIDPGEIVDTNGAGDAFVGGFLSQAVQGKGLDDCVHMGHRLAGYIIRQSGVVFGSTEDLFRTTP
jgi:adenosine kinase